MKVARLDDMVRGWFVGAFSPTALSTDVCEVAVQRFKAGDASAAHVHSIATEVTLVLSGRVRMVGREFGPGDIILIEPGEATAFEALTDAVNVVVKVPGALDDKHFVTVETNA